jgi:hypothetical protein
MKAEYTAEYRIYGIRQYEYGWEVYSTNLDGKDIQNVAYYANKESAQIIADRYTQNEPLRVASAKAWEEERKQNIIHYNTSIESYYRHGCYAGD